MAVTAGTIQTYANTVIRDDLQEAYTMLSPEETPFQQMIRIEEATSTLFEWPVVELAAPSSTNRVVEGEAAPGVDVGTLALRLSNYTQISDKVVVVSQTSQKVNAAANNVHRQAKQILLKLRELKRDMEVMLLANIAATAATASTARATAGLPAFLRTNVSFQSGGANPTLSGGTEGFPNTAATISTADALLTEVMLNNVIESCWNNGGTPSVIMCNGGNKRRISQAFVGNATRYKDTIDKKVVNSIDFYSSDFGELTVVPNRFQPLNGIRSYNVFVLDPQYLAIAFLDPVQQKPLAETGHAMSTLIWCEYGLQVDAEKAHGVIRDTNNLVA